MRHRVRQMGHAQSRSEDHGSPRIPKVFFGGDAAFGPKNIIWAVAHGHEAAISIDRICRGEDVAVRPPPRVHVASQKMGIHEWSYDNEITLDHATGCRTATRWWRCATSRPRSNSATIRELALQEAERCLNCDVQTVFTGQLCIECDACVDICPMDCITFTANGDEADLRKRLQAPAKNLSQDLYIGNDLKTGRVMVKDEDVCLHCGLCAERCPTGAWDMQKFLLDMTQRGTSMPRNAESVNDFVVRFANVNGSGSASANELFARADPAHGRARRAAQYLPVEHPGPADLVRGAHFRSRPSRRPRRHRHDGGDEPADLGQGRRRHRARRLSALRFDQAAAGVEIPRRHHRYRRAAHRDLQSRLYRSAPTPAVQEHHLSRRAVGPARHRPRRDREAVRRAVQGQGKADRRQHAGAAARPRLGAATSTCPIGLRVQRADNVGDRIFVEGNNAAALGAVYGGATVCAWYPITPSSSLAEAFAPHCSKLRASTGDRQEASSPSSRPRTNWPRSAW